MSNVVTQCMGCGSHRALVIFVPKYRGYRGTCTICGTNWPES